MPATAAPPGLVTLDDLEAAARTLAGVVVRTPLLPVDALAERAGVPVWVKPEMLQRGGAFKLRGAYNYLARNEPAQSVWGRASCSRGRRRRTAWRARWRSCVTRGRRSCRRTTTRSSSPVR